VGFLRWFMAGTAVSIFLIQLRQQTKYLLSLESD
jgi:hypothetical protein